jgi:hypothetical protein
VLILLSARNNAVSEIRKKTGDKGKKVTDNPVLGWLGIVPSDCSAAASWPIVSAACSRSASFLSAHTAATRCSTVEKPGRPYASFGGKYVPVKTKQSSYIMLYNSVASLLQENNIDLCISCLGPCGNKTLLTNFLTPFSVAQVLCID